MADKKFNEIVQEVSSCHDNAQAELKRMPNLSQPDTANQQRPVTGYIVLTFIQAETPKGEPDVTVRIESCITHAQLVAGVLHMMKNEGANLAIRRAIELFDSNKGYQDNSGNLQSLNTTKH